MTQKEFKFEVAFSFLHDDESLAYKIRDLIQDRVSTFIYSEHQIDAVGKDGIDLYTKVFLEEARIVVVLFRESWGNTPFTRIEENAIKQRSTEEGLDFCIFISLDKNKPKWISKLQIWYDFDRYGIKIAAAIIEKKIHEYGGQVHEETISEQAARHKRELTRQNNLEDYFLSKQGLIDALDEVRNLMQLAENNVDIISDKKGGIHFKKSKKDNELFSCFAHEFGLTFKWRQHYHDSLVDSFLQVFIADGDYYDINPYKQGSFLKMEEYIFYLNEADCKGWVHKKNKTDFMTTEQLITFWQKDFLERARQERMKINKEKSRY